MNRRCAVAGIAVALCGSEVHAQEILLTGPLEGAPAGHLLWREQRFEVSAALGVRLADALEPTALFAGELRYYPWERVGLGVWGAAAPFFTHRCSRFCTAIAVPELTVLPITGRSPLFGYWPYDVHLVAAPAWVWPGTGERPGRHLAASIGAGFRSFWAASFSTSLDYRALVGSDFAHVVSLSISWWPTKRRWNDE